MRVEKRSSWGKPAELAVLVLVCVALLPIVLLVTPLLIAGWWRAALRKRRLQRRFHERWGAEGKRLLLVYSNSPHWQSYIEERWLPRLEPIAVVINWSERAGWREHHALEAEIFRAVTGDREYNPVAIIIPKTGKMRVIRFWKAFRDYRHGKDQALRRAEAELEGAVRGAASPARTAGEG